MGNELLQERLDLLKGAVRFETPGRIPTSSNVWTWKILDSDKKAKIMEACLDLELMEEIVREFHERYRFDMYEDLGTRNMFCVSDPLGDPGYVVNDELGSINAPDLCLMEDDEYDEIIADPVMFGWTKVFPRKFGSFTYEQFRQAVKGFQRFGAYNVHIAKVFAEEYGVPRLKGSVHFSPVEDLFSWGLRGFKYFSRDMRRSADKVDAFIDANEPAMVAGARAALETKDPSAVFDVYTVMLAHSCMNAKQFDRFYYRSMKKLIDLTVEYNGMATFFCEDSFLRFKDFFQDVPKGYLDVTIEQDDLFQVREACPTIALTGGLPSTLLGTGTPEECVDFANSLVEGLGNGFILGQSKMISFRKDCTRENLLAVQEYALNQKL